MDNVAVVIVKREWQISERGRGTKEKKWGRGEICRIAENVKKWMMMMSKI